MKTQNFGYRQLDCSGKNIWHLERHCQRCWTRFDNSNYELDGSLPKVKNKKLIGSRKDDTYG